MYVCSCQRLLCHRNAHVSICIHCPYHHSGSQCPISVCPVLSSAVLLIYSSISLFLLLHAGASLLDVTAALDLLAVCREHMSRHVCVCVVPGSLSESLARVGVTDLIGRHRVFEDSERGESDNRGYVRSLRFCSSLLSSALLLHLLWS